ncbi:MAG: cytochrome c [Xanthomonadaceae bacterium]|nr:cytochrome c [Xanthomonadaceae bacterium]MDP2186088.1 cytochrome c [Xanthomonadales bacterium]MDZ4117483.1 cytochrome c [Xanthomonadaceae bacterium]MDZ4379445.1 cytochrome c [Xanthomonadaceae bacterium]
MREQWARLVALLTGVLLLALAAALAGWQNHNTPSAVAESVVLADQRAHGAQVYAEQGCSRCHSLAGKGNPRLPLDDVAGRRDEQALRHWIIADTAINANLSARVRSAKAGYAQLSEADMAALIAYLQGPPQPTTPR